MSVRSTRSPNKEWVRLRSKPSMKFRHLEYFVAAAEELNFTHAADRLHVSQPPRSHTRGRTDTWRSFGRLSVVRIRMSGARSARPRRICGGRTRSGANNRANKATAYQCVIGHEL